MNNVEQGSLFDGIDMENIPEEGVKYSQGCSEMYRLDKIERSAKIFTVFKEKDLAGFHLKGCDRKEPFYVVSGKVTGIEMAGDKIISQCSLCETKRCFIFLSVSLPNFMKRHCIYAIVTTLPW